MKPRRLSALGTGTAACSAFGMFEALRIADLDQVRGTGAMRTVLAVFVAYALVGLVADAGASILPGRRPAAHRALALCPVLLLPATSWARSGVSARILAVLALGLVLYRAVLGLLEHFPELGRTQGWSKLHAIMLGVAMGVGAPQDAQGMATVAVFLGAGLIALFAARRLPRAPLFANTVLLAGATLLAFREPTPAPDVPPGPDRPSFLLVTLDTLRADHVGTYGYEKGRTPNMDALAKKGVRFDVAVTHSPFTGPSHLSMLTGRLPTHLHVPINEMPLPTAEHTLADWLRREGWLTGAFVSGWPVVGQVLQIADRFHTYDDDFREFRALPFGALRVGLLQGLGRFVEHEQEGLAERPANLAADQAVRWLERAAGQPFFAWVHFYDPHLPYEPPDRFLRRETRAYTGPATGAWYGLDAGHRGAIVRDPASMTHMAELYDAEIAHADEQLGRVVAAAEKAAPSGLLIIVTSDHGEAFGEHDIYFGRDLYEPTMRVPLIIVPPDQPVTSSVSAQVKLTDLAPTIMEVAGIPPYDPMDGVSLIPWIRGSTVAETGPAFAFKLSESREYFQPTYAVRQRGMKLIERERGWDGQDRWIDGFSELYDLRTDPEELRDLIEIRPEDRRRLEGLLKPETPTHLELRLDLTPEELARLRSLGYMD